MYNNFIPLKTILDYNKTEQDFKKLLYRLNNDTTIQIKIEFPKIDEKNYVNDLSSQFEAIKKNYENYKKNPGQNNVFLHNKYACPH